MVSGGRRRRAGGKISAPWLGMAPRRLSGRAQANLLMGSIALAGLSLCALTAGWMPLGPLARFWEVQIVLDGPGALSEGEVRAHLGVPAAGRLDGLDWQDARCRLGELPRVQRADLSFAGIGSLTLGIVERRAVGLILRLDGEALEVAADGMLMEAPGRCPADLPLVSWDPAALRAVAAPGARIEVCGAPDLLAVLATLQAEFPTLWDAVSEARLASDGTYELFWNDLPTVVWGRGPLSAHRLRAWASVMEDLRRRGEIDAVVDLRFHEQILVRLPAGQKTEPGNMG